MLAIMITTIFFKLFSSMSLQSLNIFIIQKDKNHQKKIQHGETIVFFLKSNSFSNLTVIIWGVFDVSPF